MINFYLDFEATQFSNSIISIGCVAHNEKFYTLCKPVGKAKLTKFITQLTGITEEDIAEAPTIEEALNMLHNFIRRVMEAHYGAVSYFHVYGGSDKDFLLHTSEHIENPFWKEFLYNMAYSLIDDSKEVCRYFHAKTIGVHRALSYFNPELPEQKHNALEDAEMLCDLMWNIHHSDPLEEYPFAAAGKIQTETKAEKKERTLRILSMNPGLGIPDVNITLRSYHKSNKGNISPNSKDFTSWLDAVNYIRCKMFEDGKQPPIPQIIYRQLKNAVENNGVYCGRKWEKV